MASGRLSFRCASRLTRRPLVLAVLGVALLLVTSPSHAFEAFEGRVQAHGYFESQFRAMNADYSEDWDATQWYQIFNLEIELDMVQDRVGPIDLMSAFVRAEVRYDCIYSRGCGMFRSMNAYGDRSQSLPRRLLDQDRITQSGRIRVPNDPELPAKYRNFVTGRGTNTDPLLALNDPTLRLFANGGGGDGITPREHFEGQCDLGPLCTYLAGSDGVEGSVDVAQIWPRRDDPYPGLARDGGYQGIRTNEFGGPWLPKNKFFTNAANSNTPNPWDDRVGSYTLQASAYNSTLIARDENFLLPPLFDGSGNPTAELEPALIAATAAGQAAVGAGALPYRPVPIAREDGAGVDQATNPGDPRGLFIPSAPLTRLLNDNDIKGIEGDYNFSENQRAWNRGASQKDEKELKEAYLDIEMFDNRLWMRVGKQQIVWGKTELFRTTDQFNPTDNSLASLPSLEESRIALWSVRGVWSFYEVGPLDDVRLELAFNFDDYQQSDIGACGEPYAPNITCGLTFGAFAHSIFGVGLAGVEDPPDPWESLEGWEVGARLEWRYDRFSFALMDFYGYDDFPTITKISTYTRNVDPVSGRPREIFANLPTRSDTIDPYTGRPVDQIGTQGSCVNGDEDACLRPKFDYDGSGTIEPDENEALRRSPVAQQLFAYTCAGTVGFSALDPAACALNIFGSTQAISPLATVAQGIGGILAGSPTVNSTLAADAGGFVFPLVRLNVDPGDLDFDFNWVTRSGTGIGPGNPNTNGSTDPCMSPSSPTNSPCGGQGRGLIGLVGVGTTLDGSGNPIVAETLGGTLSPQQEALLGCGPLWGTQCDDDGIDLLHAEGSVLFQSWPGVEGTVQNGNIWTPWFTNQKVISKTSGLEVFATQPGTRNWYFDETRDHDVAPICTTANFGGAIFKDSADPLENDSPNGNQAVLPGCRRKWKRNPDDPAFQGDAQYLALNVYGQDLVCARERAANGGNTVSPECAGLGDFDSPRVDPRSWSRLQDGDPDNLNMQHINFGPNVGTRSVFLPTPRDVGGSPLAVPDFFYVAPFFEPVFGTTQNRPMTTVPWQPNPAVGAAFDACDPSGYPAEIIAEYGGAAFVPCGRGGHPMTGQPWSSEMAALSWNFLVLLVQQDRQVVLNERLEAMGIPTDCAETPSDPFCQLTQEEQNEIVYPIAREVFLDPDECSFVQPSLCETFRTLQGSIGLQRNIRRAGGNGRHGRRTFSWQSGGEAILTYNKRNVLGFSMDFAEDRSKANFSLEFTWIEGVEVANSLEYDGLSQTDEFNLSLSVDRPTFINFLNANRTFFFNWQFFARYRSGWEKGYTDEGPWNFVTTFAAATAYFQDRLAPSVTAVYDIRSQSGALLPAISYRFTQNFSAAVGMAFFYGKPDQRDEDIAGLTPASNRVGRAQEDLYKVDREGGLAIVRDRDEVWLRIRYTF